MSESRGKGNCRRCGHPLKKHNVYGTCEAITKKGSKCRCPMVTRPERQDSSEFNAE